MNIMQLKQTKTVRLSLFKPSIACPYGQSYIFHIRLKTPLSSDKNSHAGCRSVLESFRRCKLCVVSR